MLPGKTYKPEDALKILRKRYWYVIIPWAVVAAVTAAVARKLPDVYYAQATIQVTPPKVPDSFVKQQQNPVRLEQRLEAINQTIRTRSKLERLIGDFDLYKEERQTTMMQDVVDSMQGDIIVQPTKGDTFFVRYYGRNATTVQKVTEKLGSMFMEESYRQGNQQAEGTNSYVESQVDDAQRRLEENERLLTDYKIKHAGEMPEEQTANLTAIQGVQNQLQQVVAQLSIERINKQRIEAAITDKENETDPTPPSMATGDALPIAQQLTNAQNQLALMLVSLKPDNPQVQMQQRFVNGLKRQASDEALKVSPGSATPESPFEVAKRKQLANLRDALEQTKNSIAARQADEAKLRSLADLYQGRLNAAPTRSAELTKLMRDYAGLSKIYQDLAFQREAAKMTINLQSRQLGEQFTLIDPARTPQRPTSPNRILINVGGIFGGLALGLALVALIEYRDTTFKTDRELASVLSLPVLAVVPLMLSDVERKAQFRRRLVTNLGLGSAVAVCGAVLVYTFLFVK